MAEPTTAQRSDGVAWVINSRAMRGPDALTLLCPVDRPRRPRSCGCAGRACLTRRRLPAGGAADGDFGGVSRLGLGLGLWERSSKVSDSRDPSCISADGIHAGT